MTELKYWRVERRRRRHRRPRGPSLARRRHAARHGDLHLDRGRDGLAGRAPCRARSASTAGVEYIVSYVTHDNYCRRATASSPPTASSPSTGSTTTASGGPAGDPLAAGRRRRRQRRLRLRRRHAGRVSYAGNNYWVDLTFDPADVAGNHGTDDHLGGDPRFAREPRRRRDDHRQRRRRRRDHLRDRRRRRRRPLHHRRPDRPALLRAAPRTSSCRSMPMATTATR